MCEISTPKLRAHQLHHQQEHGFVARRSTVQFCSIAEFQAWKEKTERKEQAHFILKRGVTRLFSGATKRHLECHCTGVAVQSGDTAFLPTIPLARRQRRVAVRLPCPLDIWQRVALYFRPPPPPRRIRRIKIRPAAWHH
ncbi:hypothetical protein V5799_004679 [Amblyomma americanum]|uniref:Uncharacterized protein n=1 Tax=Amblyomma americanum TaxID=6943 RepID=A0AAQ4D5F1_AMBAM